MNVADIAIILGAIRFRHQQSDIPAQDLSRTIAEQTFGGGVEAFDQAVLVDGDDPIDRRIENCGGPALADPQCPLRGPQAQRQEYNNSAQDRDADQGRDIGLYLHA